ncbi:MAG: hypothetical protein ACXU86_14140, partial [Archangium sp.]
ETDKPFTLAAVQAVLLARALQASREAEPTQAMRQLAARSVGARRSDADSLRLAALRSWLVPTSEPLAPQPVASPSSARNELASAPDPAFFDTAAPAPEELRSFAERVREAAKASASGRFGEDKIFISHVWRTLRDQLQGLDEQSFKSRLVEANREQLLSLSRADLVEAMNPSDVAESETRHLGATFHFIAL